jgi:peptidoglycan-N-acetylglucosamine deacetylase
MNVLASRCFAVSVDLDPIRLYHGIHGLAAPDGEAADSALDRALERFLDFARELDIPLTLFVVASETERPRFVELLKQAVSAGHELGNHTLDHPYDLIELDRDEQRQQITRALDLIEQRVGVRPRGFRAPGYAVTDELLEIVAEGHVYDSSVFPSAAYYAAKLGARALMALRGRRSTSIFDSPRMLLSPTRPYRLGRPYHRPGHGLVELPIQVTPRLRLPYIGTSLTLAGESGARLLTAALSREPFVNLELHALDLLSLGDGADALGSRQPDYALPVIKKRGIFSALVHSWTRTGRLARKLEDVARCV